MNPDTYHALEDEEILGIGALTIPVEELIGGLETRMRIGISGKQGSGKTTLAEEFVRRYDFERTSFAGKVKEVAMELFGLTYEEAFGSEKNRELLQQLGDGMRNIDPDVWVNYIIRSLEPTTEYVVDDLRYENEFDALKEAGFVLVRLEASPEMRQARIGDSYANPDHPTEVSLDHVKKWDFIVENDKLSVDELRDMARVIYEARRTR